MVDPAGQAVPASPLLATKFFVPRWRPGLVPRARLIERLTRGSESKLTLVSAPPGFGKSTLLAEWLGTAGANGRNVAWLSLDENDNHPGRFWTYLVTALQRAQSGIGASAISFLESPQPVPIETALATLINDLGAITNDLVLVLDDYHVIEAGPIHESVAFLLDHAPPQLHLVIASRADPMLPIARLRVRGELTEIRAADLRFTADEAARFLKDTMGLHLSAANVAALESRTEGWIAALQLAALSMQGRDDIGGFITAFTGDDRYIVDYLVQEVLERQSDHLRTFLLQTSILDRLNAPLCDATTGLDNGKAMLETLERGNLFLVPLDDRRQWFRYHHLFADVLRAHLVEEQPGQVSILHGRASEWYAREGQPDRAIRHALAANDLTRAAGLVELEAESAMRSHQPARIVEWLKPIPDDLIRSMPVLSTYFGMALQGIGDMEGSASRLNDAERWLGDVAESALPIVVDREGFESIPSRIALGRGYLTMAAGDSAATVVHARRALDLLTEDEHHWHGTASALLALAHWSNGELDAAQPFHDSGLASLERAGIVGLAIMSAFHSAELLRARGRLVEAQHEYERSLQRATRQSDPPLPHAANLHLGLSELCCERNDFAGGSHHILQAENLGVFFTPRTPYRHCAARARLLASQGDLDAALELLDEGERLYVRGAVPNVRPFGSWKTRVRLAQGKLAEAFEWTRAQGLSADDVLNYRREYDHITLARVLVARFQSQRDAHALREAEGLLGRLREAAETGGRMGAVIEILLLQAMLHQANDDVAAGLGHLEGALALAEPEGYFRTFVDEGTPMRDLLRHAVASGTGGAYARRLLAAFEGPALREPKPGASNTPGLAEPLTAREVEILRLVAAGMRNQEIADHLVISLPTVKRHIANTYGKLGAGHRTEAIARANQLNLL